MCYDIKSTMSGEDDDATVTRSVSMMLIKPNPVTIKSALSGLYPPGR